MTLPVPRLPHPTPAGVRTRVHSALAMDRAELRRTVLLAGSARSGTTWVEEVIDHAHDHRVLFEPFHTRYVPEVAGWRTRQYIRPGDRDPYYLQPATLIANGRVRGKWVDQANRRWMSRKRLIKEVRGQLFLRWFATEFPEVPVILLLRHPCAVVESRVRLGWEAELGDLLAQPKLVEDYLGPVAEEMAAETDEFARHVWLWAAENSVPLRQFAPGEVIVVFYEDLLREPEREMDRLLSWVGDAATAEVLAASARPSARSADKQTVRSGEERLNAWRGGVSRAQTGRAVEILARFGLDAVYGEGDLPLVDAGDVLGILPG